jgi:hypothetical protein
MTSNAKRVLNAATRSETYWNLSDAEKLIWMIERAYQMGKKSSFRNAPRGTARAEAKIQLINSSGASV